MANKKTDAMANKTDAMANKTDSVVPVRSTGRGGKNNFPAAQIPDTDPGDNTKFLRHALATLDLPPIDISDARQVEERLFWYFEHCATNDMKPTVNGMCNSLGICRNTLNTWNRGEFRGGTHQQVVQKAYRLLEELWEDYMLNGKINPVSGIFLAKNMFSGYSDTQEVVLTPNQPADVATIEAKYAELPEN